MIELCSGGASVSLSPELGASLMRYALQDGREILRPSPDPTDAFDCACYLLAPWCNRIANGITGVDGQFHPIAPTHPAHPLPIHGSAALSAWDVLAQDATSAMLRVEVDWPEPFHYAAQVHWALVDAALTVELRVTHLGDEPLPYGLGVHPWFRRTSRSALQATATHWQRTDAQMLPRAIVPVSDTPDWNFGHLRSLPDRGIDTAFAGWDGQARLQIEPSLSLNIKTDPPLSYYQVYSTGAEADFVCFEPVSHPIDSHNSTGHPGLVWLDAGQSTAIKVTFSPQQPGP